MFIKVYLDQAHSEEHIVNMTHVLKIVERSPSETELVFPTHYSMTSIIVHDPIFLIELKLKEGDLLSQLA